MPRDKIKGRAYPLGLANVDTDKIIAAEWLKTISRQGLGRAAFQHLRRSKGNVFDDPQYAGSPILIAGENFGCGSSREHAAWALRDMGIEAVIAPSFSDIFSSNAFKNGIATVVLSQRNVDRLLEAAESLTEIEIDLADQHATSSRGERFNFEMDPFRKACLIDGLDEIALTLGSSREIDNYESKVMKSRPWLLRPAVDVHR